MGGIFRLLNLRALADTIEGWRLGAHRNVVRHGGSIFPVNIGQHVVKGCCYVPPGQKAQRIGILRFTLPQSSGDRVEPLRVRGSGNHRGLEAAAMISCIRSARGADERTLDANSWNRPTSLSGMPLGGGGLPLRR